MDTPTPSHEVRRTTKNPAEFKALTICDAHLSAHTPAAFKVDYWELTRATIRKILKFADNQKVDAVLWAGDVFHLKSAQRNPTHFLTEVVELLLEYPLLHLGIAGNHDIKFGHIDLGLEGQPLDLLIKAGIYHLLDRQEWVFVTNNRQVRIAGQSFDHGRASGAVNKTKKGATDLITLGHFWYGPQTRTYFGEHVYGPDVLGHGESDVYVIGHHHEDQGVNQVDGKYYVTIGSISRTGTHQHDLHRRPAAGLITIPEGGISVKIIHPNVPPAEDILDLQKREQIMQEKKEIEEFTQAMASATVNAADPRTVLDELSPPARVREKVLEYLANAERQPE